VTGATDGCVMPLAEGLLQSLERRFAGVIYNLAQNSAVSDETVGKTLPFGDLMYPVSSAMDPEFRLDWLLELQVTQWLLAASHCTFLSVLCY